MEDDKFASLKDYWRKSKAIEKETALVMIGRSAAITGAKVDLDVTLAVKKDDLRSFQHPAFDKIISDCSEIDDECKYGQKKMEAMKKKMDKTLDDHGRSSRKLMDVLCSDNPCDFDAIAKAQEAFDNSSAKMAKSYDELLEFNINK